MSGPKQTSDTLRTNSRLLARVGLVYSQQTAWYYGGEHVAANVENHALGWYQALIESRIPFDMVHDHLLGREALASYKTLILPNIAALSDAQCDQLPKRLSATAVNLIATFETSLYDEWERRRERNFALR